MNMLTLAHYRAVRDNGRFWRALGNTLRLGVLGATITTAPARFISEGIAETGAR
jgi:ABC-type spermidine/putrescine transport system permease subunit II